MKNRLQKFLFLLLVSVASMQASTMYLLTEIPKAYLVVENYSKKVSAQTREEIMNSLKEMTDEAGIDTSGYSYRTLAFIIYDTYLEDHQVINVELVLGEEIKRLDDAKEVYGLTYRKQEQFLVGDKDEDELQEAALEAADNILSEFSTQYEEDNE